MASIFKSLHSAESLCKDAFLVTIFTEYLWTVGQTGEKNLCFQTKMDTCGQALSCDMYVGGGVNYQYLVFCEIELRFLVNKEISPEVVIFSGDIKEDAKHVNL